MDTDIIHSFGDHIEWNESFYFSFYDREKDINAFMRIGLKPNKNEKSIFCFFMLPDGSLIGFKDQSSYDNDSLEVKGLKFEKILPEKFWKLSFSGSMAKMNGRSMSMENVSFLLDYKTLNNIFDYRECVSGIKEEISKSVASEHLEQFGKVTGKLKIGDLEYQINALGERDHSWGIRDWNAPKMWIWLTCQFNENHALNVTKLVVEQGEVDAGFIHVNGRNIPIMAAKIDTIFNNDGSPGSFNMELEDKNGDIYKVSAIVKKRAMMPFESPDKKTVSIMHETLAQYELNGMKGFGIAEYLMRK
jgi:hypothetical protein